MQSSCRYIWGEIQSRLFLRMLIRLTYLSWENGRYVRVAIIRYFYSVAFALSVRFLLYVRHYSERSRLRKPGAFGKFKSRQCVGHRSYAICWPQGYFVSLNNLSWLLVPSKPLTAKILEADTRKNLSHIPTKTSHRQFHFFNFFYYYLLLLPILLLSR